jgi:transposase
MRKGFLGLEGLVRIALQKDPLSGDIFVFVNRSGTHLKCLFWDRTGFIIVYKRLEHGKFRFHGAAGQLELDENRLALLLDGMKVGGISSKS